MKKSFQRVIATLNLFQGKQSLTIFLLAAFFDLSACDDSSSAGGDNGSGSTRGGIPDTVETFMELSDYDCGKSQKCVATYLTEYHNMAVCDGDNGWVIGTLIEKMDCDFSSSSAKSSDSKSSASEEPESSGSEGVEGSSASVPGSSDASVYGVVIGTLIDSRDGQTYRTVKIGGQVWMAENLNYAYTGVPFDYDGNTSDSTSWCYDNDPANCAKYGRLYTWAAAMDSVGEWSTSGKGCGYGENCSVASAGSATLVRGICPKGWHLPSHDEWEALIVAVDGSITEYTSSNTAGTKLKAQTGWKINGNGTDAFGFSALPAGYRNNYGGSFGYGGLGVYFWSSTEDDSGSAYSMFLDHDYDNADLGDYGSKYEGFSVRCLKDSE